MSGNGNIAALVDANQYVVGRYLYDPFGRMLGKWGNMADLNEMQFSSIPYHGLSDLILYPYRAYSPSLQRWLSRDPIGEKGGHNLYASCGNDLVGETDPFGFDPWAVQWHHNYPQEFRPEFSDIGINIDLAENGTMLPAWLHGQLGRDYNDAWQEFFYPNGRQVARTTAQAEAYLRQLQSSDRFKDILERGITATSNFGRYRYRGFVFKSVGTAATIFAVVALTMDSQSVADDIVSDALLYAEDSQLGTANGDTWAYVDLLDMRQTINGQAAFAGDVAMAGIIAKKQCQHN